MTAFSDTDSGKAPHIELLSLGTTVSVIRRRDNLSDKDLPGLTYFDTSFEVRARNVLTSDSVTNSSVYNPLLISQLFTDITTILNRCLSSQRDYYDFEQSALQAARDYKNFDDQKENQKKLERADYFVEVAKKQRDTSQDGAKEGATMLVTQLNARSKLVDDKYAKLEKYYESIKARHAICGSALNYKERATTLWAFLTSDLQEAYIKIRTVAKGAKYVYGLSAFPAVPTWKRGDEPKDGEEGALGQLVLWTKEMVRLINIEEEQYSDIFVTVPLKAGSIAVPAPATATSAVIPFGLIAADAFKNFTKPDVLVQTNISLRQSVPQSMTNLRLAGVGLSYSLNAPDVSTMDKTMPLWTHPLLSATIFPPDVPLDLGYAGSVKRAPIFIQDVSGVDFNAAARVIASDDLVNVDPLGYLENSNWRIVISPLQILAAKETVLRGPDDISQIYLHLKMRGKLSRDPQMWNAIKNHA